MILGDYHDLNTQLHEAYFPIRYEHRVEPVAVQMLQGLEITSIARDTRDYFAEHFVFELYQISTNNVLWLVNHDPSPTALAAARINYRQLLIRRPR